MDGAGYLMQAKYWGSGTGWPCAKGFDELRKESLKKILRSGGEAPCWKA